MYRFGPDALLDLRLCLGYLHISSMTTQFEKVIVETPENTEKSLAFEMKVPESCRT